MWSPNNPPNGNFTLYLTITFIFYSFPNSFISISFVLEQNLSSLFFIHHFQSLNLVVVSSPTKIEFRVCNFLEFHIEQSKSSPIRQLDFFFHFVLLGLVMSNAKLNKLCMEESDPMLKTIVRCKHGSLLHMQTSWSKSNPGRRFWSCPYYGVCDFSSVV